jgi:mannose-6-phosphate isomerase-like protein (cupin superfamily)
MPPLPAGLFAAPLADGAIESPESLLLVVEWTVPGGGTDPPQFIAPLHIHHDDDEAWYVLEGILSLRVGDHDVDVPAGGRCLSREEPLIRIGIPARIQRGTC